VASPTRRAISRGHPQWPSVMHACCLERSK